MNANDAAWIIDTDHLGAGCENVGATHGDVMTSGSGFMGSTINCQRFTENDKPEIIDPMTFQLRDDDGELYITGRIAKALYEEGEEVFHPLSWGEASLGCTELRINGKVI